MEVDTATPATCASRCAATSTSPPTRRSPTRTRRPSAAGAARVILDFANVDYINSHRDRARSSGCWPRPAGTTARSSPEGLSDHYREIFRITRLSDYLTIADPPSATSVPEEAAR